MRITVDDDDVVSDVEGFKTGIPRAAQLAARAETEELARQLRTRVVDMIPDKGGWYDIYKESLQVKKISDDEFWVVAEMTDIQFSRMKAHNTLVWLSGGNPAVRLLSSYNPWTIDTIPSIEDGLTCDLVVRPSSESETSTHRAQRLIDRGSVDRKLVEAGFVVHPLDAQLPLINGRVVADVPFLALRLEHGLGGFPRTPIWSKLDGEVVQLSKTEKVRKAGENVFAKRWFDDR